MGQATLADRAETISPEYRQLQKDLHTARADYGVASKSFAPQVARVIAQSGVDNVLDYGAGKGRLAPAVGQELQKMGYPGQVRFTLYDPAIEDISVPPQPHQMVACIDVLEHIEPEYLDTVLAELRRLTQGVGFYSIHCGPAVKVLADGRNAHLIQEKPNWWLSKLIENGFEVAAMQRTEAGFWVIVQ